MVHTKLSSSNSGSSNALMNNRTTDEKRHAMDLRNAHQAIKMSTPSKTIIHDFVANIFIKEVNLVLYDDSKDHLYKKTNIASMFLDDFIICYVEEVR